MELDEYLKKIRQIINDEIKKVLDEEAHPLTDHYKHCLSSGKRFRPVLVTASAEACGMEYLKVIPAALSMELIHNFSLVHDDLPCMDNDDTRRGIPTCHARFGETDALLCGDGLLIFAFSLLARNGDIPGIDPRALIRVLKLFSHSAGHHGMTGGQVLDMVYQHRESVGREILEEIHRKKTGALITASVTAGGILAGAAEDAIDSLRCYGENIGLTYQIIDDILDMDEDKATISFPAVFGVEESKKMAADATAEAIRSLERFDEKADILRKLAKYLLDRKI